MYTSKIHITLLPWERAVGPSLVPQCPGLRPGRETLPPSTKDIRIYHAYNPDKSIGMSSLSWFLISQCLFIYLTLLVNMDGAMIGLFTFHSSFKILAYCSYISKEVSDVWSINSFFYCYIRSQEEDFLFLRKSHCWLILCYDKCLIKDQFIFLFLGCYTHNLSGNW